MRVHYLQHAPFEGLGHIEHWLDRKQYSVSSTKLYMGQALPTLDKFDALIVMGGPMGIYDDTQHPWLIEERSYIKSAIDEGKTTLGVCLGAQLVADALGASIYANTEKEIGWFTVRKTSNANHSVFGDTLPQNFTAFHWHGDTFDLPAGGIPLLSSDACRNQAFSFNDRVLALQFHMEFTAEMSKDWVNAGRHELTAGKYIQSSEKITETDDHYNDMHRLLENLLEQLFSNA